MGINKPISLEGQNIEVDLTGVNNKLETLTTELATVKSNLSTVSSNVSTVKTNVSTIKTNTTAKSFKQSKVTMSTEKDVTTATTKRVTLTNGKLVSLCVEPTDETSITAFLKVIADGVTIFDNSKNGTSSTDTKVYLTREYDLKFITQSTAPHKALDIEFKSLEVYCSCKAYNTSNTKTLVIDYIG